MKTQKQIMTKRVGIETLNEQQQNYWQKKGVEYRPILEYKPLTQEEEDRLKTEYYDNNNRVGFETLYYAVHDILLQYSKCNRFCRSTRHQ